MKEKVGNVPPAWDGSDPDSLPNRRKESRNI
jgi:hypothetical protein